MQRGYEEDAVLVLKLVVQLTLVRERNKKRPSGSFFPVFPKVSGRDGGRWGLAALGKVESTRGPGWRRAYHFPQGPFPSSLGVGDLNSLRLEARVGQWIIQSPIWA